MTETASYASWITSKYATSWPVALLIVFNYVGTGYLVPTDDAASNGVNSHLLDLVWSSGMALALCAFDYFYRTNTKRTFLGNVMAWISSSAVATLFAFTAVLLISGSMPTVDYSTGLVLGISSLLGSAVSFTLIVAGFREGRPLMRSLKKLQRQLLTTRASAVETLSRFAQQLREPLHSLQSKLKQQLGPMLQLGAATTPAVRAVNSFITDDLRGTVTQLQNAKAHQVWVTPQSRQSNQSKWLQVEVRHSISLIGLYSLTILFSVRQPLASQGCQDCWALRSL